ncbi:MAG: NAD-dependent epimerase/dehydratase family protein [Chloroflexota bacterium]|nr:NAD-dependent epimerase/dehydratase family protein [Chloroflexota bacterium]
MKKIMNSLVLGGNGFIGSHLVDLLLREGHQVRVYDRADDRFRSRLAQVEYIYGELGNQGLIRAALTDVEIVFHLVSTTVPGTSNADPAFDVQSNVVDTIRLLEECVAAQIKRFVFTSSGGTIYGIPQAIPIPESHFLNPTCSYGITKLAIEKYLALFRHLYGMEYVILRPSNAYGERQNPFGQQGVVGVFLGKVIRQEPIVIWGDGSVTRDFIYVGDLAAALYQAAIHDLKFEGGERIFNIGSGRGVSINEILEAISVVVGQDMDVRYTQARRFDVPVNVLDISLSEKRLGWTPTTDLPSGLSRTWAWIKEAFTDDSTKTAV